MTHITVVTQPVGDIGQSQMKSLLEIMTEVADVSLIAGEIDDPYLKQHQTHQYTSTQSGKGVVSDSLGFARNQITLCSILNDIKTDIIWFNGMQLYLLPILYGKTKDAPVVIQPKGDVSLALYLNWGLPDPVRSTLFFLLQNVERISYAVSDYDVFYSPSMADEYGISDAITNGMRFISDDYSYETPFDERNSRIGFLGRHNSDKNIEVLVEIAKETDYDFHFAGTGPKLEWVKEQTRGDDSITVYGWVDDPCEFLNGLKLLVYPSTPIEGLPTTIMEAHACGTPTITTAVSGNPDIVIDGETGYLVDEASPREIVDVIENTSEDELQTMSRNCREMASTEFTKEAAVERYKSIIETVTNQGQS